MTQVIKVTPAIVDDLLNKHRQQIRVQQGSKNHLLANKLRIIFPINPFQLWIRSNKLRTYEMINEYMIRDDLFILLYPLHRLSNSKSHRKMKTFCLYMWSSLALVNHLTMHKQRFANRIMPPPQEFRWVTSNHGLLSVSALLGAD